MIKLKVVKTVGELKEYLNSLPDQTILLSSQEDYFGYSEGLTLEKVFAKPEDCNLSWYPSDIHQSMIDSSIKPAIFIY